VRVPVAKVSANLQVKFMQIIITSLLLHTEQTYSGCSGPITK
jgi:hypothetical protein